MYFAVPCSNIGRITSKYVVGSDSPVIRKWEREDEDLALSSTEVCNSQPDFKIPIGVFLFPPHRKRLWSPSDVLYWPVLTLGLTGCCLWSGTIFSFIKWSCRSRATCFDFLVMLFVSALCGPSACRENRQWCGTIYNQLVCIAGPRLRWRLEAISRARQTCSLGLPHQWGEQSITDMQIQNEWKFQLLLTV